MLLKNYARPFFVKTRTPVGRGAEGLEILFSSSFRRAHFLSLFFKLRPEYNENSSNYPTDPPSLLPLKLYIFTPIHFAFFQGIKQGRRRRKDHFTIFALTIPKACPPACCCHPTPNSNWHTASSPRSDLGSFNLTPSHWPPSSCE